MGRFYNATSPQFLDNQVYQLPFEAMGNTIKQINEDYDKQVAGVDSMLASLAANALPQQTDRKNAIITGFEKRAEELIKLSSENPTEFIKRKGELRTLKNDIHKEFTRGDISTITGNYETMQKHFASEAKRVGAKENGINQQDLTTYKDLLSNSFQGERKDKTLNTINPETLNEYVDAEALGQSIGDNYRENITSTIREGTRGGYIETKKNGSVIIDKNEVANDVYNGLLADPKFNAYYDQKTRLYGEESVYVYRDKVTGAYLGEGEEASTEEGVESTSVSKKNAVALGVAERVSNKESKNDITDEQGLESDATSRMFIQHGYDEKEKKADVEGFTTGRGVVVNPNGTTAEENKSIYLANNENITVKTETVKAAIRHSLKQKGGGEIIEENVNRYTKNVLSGLLDEKAIIALGLNVDDINSTINSITESNIIINQNRATKKRFDDQNINSNPSRIADFDTFLEGEGQKPHIETTAHYSLQGYGLTTVEIKELNTSLQNGVRRISMTFTANEHKALSEKGLVIKPGTPITLGELIRAGVYEPPVVTKKVGEEDKTETYIDDDGVKRERDVTIPIEFKTMMKEGEGFPSFQIEPSTLGVSNSKDINSDVNYAVQFNYDDGSSNLGYLSVRDLGNTGITAKVNSKHKVYTTKDVLAKGAMSGSYNIIPGIDVVELNGIQYLYTQAEAVGSSPVSWGAVKTLDSTAIENLAETIFR